MKSVRISVMLIVVVILLLSASQGAVPVDNEAVFIGRGGYRLGVVLSDLDEDRADESGVKEGAYVLEVIGGSEAERGRPCISWNSIIFRGMCANWRISSKRQLF